MGAYEDELKILEEDFINGWINIKEYNQRLVEIEKEEGENDA